MKEITKTYQVYKFNELSPKKQETAICNHIDFWLEITPYDSEHASPNFKKACDEAERMQTPWFVGEYVYDYCKDEIIEEIKLNDYDFFSNGELA